MNYLLKKEMVLSKNLRTIFRSGLDRAEVIDDDGESLLIQWDQWIEGPIDEERVVSLELNNSVFSPIYMALAKLNDNCTKAEMLKFLNSFNEDSSLINFYIDENGWVIAKAVYIADEFVAEHYLALLEMMYTLLRSNCYYHRIKMLLSDRESDRKIAYDEDFEKIHKINEKSYYERL